MLGILLRDAGTSLSGFLESWDVASRTHAGKLRPSPADHSCPSSLHHIVTLILERENQTTLYLLGKVTTFDWCRLLVHIFRPDSYFPFKN